MQQINFVTIMKQEKHYINSIYYQLEQTAKYCKHLGTQLFQKLDLPVSLDEFSTLDTIKIYGEVCQRDLAKLILKDRPSTGRILNSLEEKGLIKRFADTKNNRLVRKTTLTIEGEKLLDEVTKILKDYFISMPEILSGSKVEELKLKIKEFKEALKEQVEMNI
ncbi:MarR family transcriptional regulator [bacterium]|nr:MarR family transcriptional regulator [bacterium]